MTNIIKPENQRQRENPKCRGQEVGRRPIVFNRTVRLTTDFATEIQKEETPSAELAVTYPTGKPQAQSDPGAGFHCSDGRNTQTES